MHKKEYGSTEKLGQSNWSMLMLGNVEVIIHEVMNEFELNDLTKN